MFCIKCDRYHTTNSEAFVNCYLCESTYYKVVTEDMKSLGLRKNPTILKYKINEWVKSPTVKRNNEDDGGIWVVKMMSNANKLKKYMEKKYNKRCKIYKAIIWDILYENSYRTKTSKVKLKLSL